MNITYRNLRNLILFRLDDLIRSHLSQDFAFISTTQLIKWSREWALRLPSFDIIVGIPRSGLIPAMEVSMVTDTPFTTLQHLREGRGFKFDAPSAARLRCGIHDGVDDDWVERSVLEFPKAVSEPIHKAFVVEDTLSTGRTFRPILASLEVDFPEIEFVPDSVLYSKEFDPMPECLHHIKANIRGVPCEWNLCKRDLGKVVSDMDGVLCEDAPFQGYDRWLPNASPKFVPRFLIDTIFTARREQYHRATEDWLSAYDIQYRKLVMGSSLGDRISMVRRMHPKPDLIFESDEEHAYRIWKGTGVPTLCFSTMTMFCRKKVKV
jgi:hypothetical protein